MRQKPPICLYFLRTPGGSEAVRWWLDFMGSWGLKVGRDGSERAKQFHTVWAAQMRPLLAELKKAYEELYFLYPLFHHRSRSDRSIASKISGSLLV